jgi:hypothetical protein
LTYFAAVFDVKEHLVVARAGADFPAACSNGKQEVKA